MFLFWGGNDYSFKPLFGEFVITLEVIGNNFYDGINHVRLSILASALISPSPADFLFCNEPIDCAISSSAIGQALYVSYVSP